MADLAQLQSGVSAPAYRTNALNLGQDAPAALPPDTSKLSAAQGHAALMGTVAKTLSELPGIILGNYVQGKTIPTKLKANEALSGVLNGQTPSLPAGTHVTPEGVSYTAPDPNAMALSKANLEDKQADTAYKNARAKALGEGGAGMSDNPLVSAFGGGDNGTPSGGTVDDGGKPIGTATSYGYKGDHFGGPSAASSTTGPNGNALDADSLAVSPDIEAKLKALGYKFGDTVTFQTAGGATVTRRWDDRTAQYDPTGQWSVDDKGRQIMGENGKPLPALKGRFDFHAEPIKDNTGKVVGWKPSRYNGISITGITPKGGALSGADEPPLPTGGANSQPAPALADGAQPALASDGMPVSLDGSPAPAASPAPATDGTFDPQAALSATGGVKVTDQGHAGGVVTRYPGFLKEETEDGTTYIYPNKVKAGQKPFMVFKKPVHYTSETTKLASAAGYQPKAGETEASVAANSRAMLNDADKVSPDVRPQFMRWGSSLQSNPVVKEFYTARHQMDVTDAALSSATAKGIPPAAALGIIDAYVKAMRGGAATQGMTKILSEGQPLLEQVKLHWQKLTGGAGTNAVLTKEMADDVRNIMKRIEAASQKEVEGMKDGDKEYLSTIGIPPGAVEKTYKRILTGKTPITGVDDGQPAPAASTGTPAAPAQIQAQKAAAAKAVKTKYDAGGYTGEDKVRAEALLRANGLLPATAPAPKTTGAIEG